MITGVFESKKNGKVTARMDELFRLVGPIKKGLIEKTMKYA